MTPETPTPETDEHSDRMDYEDFDVELALTYDLARRLERERDAARAENEAMREAIKEAHTTLEGIAKAKPSEWGEMSDQFKPWAQNRARHALVKLQPFLKP